MDELFERSLSASMTSQTLRSATLAAHPPRATSDTLHLCVDMQNMFAEETPWHTPWMKRVLPVVAALVERHPDRTIFTRFIPPDDAGGNVGRLATIL